MRRRDFIAGLTGAAAWPLATRAQQPNGPKVVGLINAVSFGGPYAGPVAAVRQSLQEAGFVEGANLTIELRSADGRYERLPELVADLVRSGAAAIVAIGASPAALATAKAAAATVPIVFANGSDAVEVGLVESRDGAEGNPAGAPAAAPGLAAKRLELLLELLQRGPVIGYLDNSRASTAFAASVQDVTAAARAKGRELVVFDAATEREIGLAFTRMALEGVRALVVSPDPFLTTRQEQIIALAELSRMPTIYAARGAVALGGLMSYGIITDDIYRLAGIYAGRILNGAAPADTPMLIPTRFELVINARTARALRTTVPRRLLLRADEVIN